VTLDDRGATPALFLLPPVTGDLDAYRDLVVRLGGRRRLRGFEAPGLHDDDEPFTVLEELAKACVDGLRLVQPDRPYLLAGWSVGGVVAFEMACQLKRAGAEVSRLVIIDARAPGPQLVARQDVGGAEPHRFAMMYLQHRARNLGRRVSAGMEEFRELRGADLAARVALELAALGCHEPATELPRRLRVFEANIRRLTRYQPGHYPGPLTLLESSEELPEHPRPATLGWESHAERVDHRRVPGHHFNLVFEPHAATLAREIHRALDGVEDSVS
jgi:thioesterase domain-containing protein